MEKINFQDGQLVEPGYVEIDGVKHQITEAEYEGNTPLSSFVLNKMQDNIETELTNIEQEGIIVSPTEPTENRRKVWMQKGIELYDSSKNISGKYIDINGQEINNEGWTITDYMPISNNIYIGLTDVGNAPHSAFYNENKEFVSSFKQSAGNNYLNKVENAKYVRFSIPNVDINNFRFESLNTQYILNADNVYEEFMKKEEKKILSKQVLGNTGQYGNIDLKLEISKYIILEMVATAVSTVSGSLMALRIGSGTTHYAHVITDKNHEIATNADVNITVYYIEI